MKSPGSYKVPDEFFPSFTVLMPRLQTVPFVFSSPHSGRIYPEQFLQSTRLDPVTLRRSEDCFVDLLFQHVARAGAPLLSARFPRAYLDLNREPYELDPDLVDDPLPAHANAQSIRVAGGLGTVARIVADGEPIYDRMLGLEEVLTRIDQLYFPFHRALSGLMEETTASSGYAVLIDCHSMPSAAMAPGSAGRPDVVIGDRFGTSADVRLSEILRDAFARRGLKTMMNRPYAGGYITEHYGRPSQGWHAIQIELNRGLYLDEVNMTASDDFENLKTLLSEVCIEMFSGAPTLFGPRAAAAE